MSSHISCQIHFKSFEDLSDIINFCSRGVSITSHALKIDVDSHLLSVSILIFSPRTLAENTPYIFGHRSARLESGLLEYTDSADEQTGSPSSSSLNKNTSGLYISPSAFLVLLEEAKAQGKLSIEFSFPVSADSRAQGKIWTYLNPPQTSWTFSGTISSWQIEQYAQAGIDEFSETIPVNPGALLVHNIRDKIWTQEVTYGKIIGPRAASFAAKQCGFIPDRSDLRVFSDDKGQWERLTSNFGHILIYQARIELEVFTSY